MKEEGNNWSINHHFGLGDYIRNLLRQGGFY